MQVFVERQGAGPPLVMLNGIGGHTAMWGPVAIELGRTRELILLDAPGCGRSPALPSPMRMRGLAGLVTETLDSLNLEVVDLLGYSWGGALAQQVAHDMPARVRRLILASTIPGLGGQPPGPLVTIRMLTPSRYRSRDAAYAHAARIYGGAHRPDDGRTTPVLEHWSTYPPSFRGYAQQLFAIAGWTSLPWLHQLPHPTLIVSGDDDPLVPTLNAKLLAWLVPRSSLHLIEDGGHLWLLDNPVEGAALIESFLSGPCPPARPSILPALRRTNHRPPLVG